MHKSWSEMILLIYFEVEIEVPREILSKHFCVFFFQKEKKKVVTTPVGYYGNLKLVHYLVKR